MAGPLFVCLEKKMAKLAENILKNKDNKRKKRLLLKIFNKKDNIKNVLKSYFLKWQRIHNLLLINDSVILIQRNWKRKKIGFRIRENYFLK